MIREITTKEAVKVVESRLGRKLGAYERVGHPMLLHLQIYGTLEGYPDAPLVFKTIYEAKPNGE